MIFQALASPFGGKLVQLSDAFSWIKDKRTQWAQSPSTLTNTIISLLWTGVRIAITEAVLVSAGYIGPDAALEITGVQHKSSLRPVLVRSAILLQNRPSSFPLWGRWPHLHRNPLSTI